MPSGEGHHKWKGGKASYRQRALKKYGRECGNQSCQIRAAGIVIPEEMLDVDHIDNDRENNSLENLKVLCVWCHAVKTRL
jgi:hypothetical protein